MGSTDPLPQEVVTIASLNWGDVPTWLAAAGTISAVFVALNLARRDAYREAIRESRHQAELITGWVEKLPHGEERKNGRMCLRLVVQNGSAQCAYRLIASLVSLQGAFRDTAVGDGRDDFRTPVGLVPPGKLEDRIRFGGNAMHLRFGVELAFQDAAGRNWLRRGNGLLEQVQADSITLYGIRKPVAWHR